MAFSDEIWDNDSEVDMSGKRFIPAVFAGFILALGAPAAAAESIGLRLSYGPPTLSGGDVNSWIRASNNLWSDWAVQTGRRMDGRISEMGFDAGPEAELSIRLYGGLSFRIGGGRLQSRSEGSILLLGSAQDQSESYAMSARMTAVYAKIGLVYSYPIVGNLNAHIGGGRHLSLLKYESWENYEARFAIFGRDYVYLFEKTGTFRSEGLGYYALFGLEYTVFKHVGFVIDVENIWSRVDGFKGPLTYRRLGPADEREYVESGGASLYFYESRPAGLDSFYSVLSGEKNRPEGETARAVRQGIFDFSGTTVRFGLRLKF